MKNIEFENLPDFISRGLDHNVEPVLKQSDENHWNLFFQREDVGFPFSSFHYVVVSRGEIVSMPLSEWLNLFGGATFDHMKIDLRDGIKPLPYPAPMDVPYQCQNCQFESPRSAFVRPRDVLSRIEADELFTDSECPQCGALAQPISIEHRRGLAVMHLVMRKLDEGLGSLPREEACFDVSKLVAHLVALGPELADECSLEMLKDMD